MKTFYTSRLIHEQYVEQLNAEAYADGFSRKISKEFFYWNTENKNMNLKIADLPAKSYSDLLLEFDTDNEHHKVAVELKYRDKDLNIEKYLTHIIGIDKLSCFDYYFKNGSINGGYIMTFFALNGQIWISPVLNVDSTGTIYGNNTTNSGTHTDGKKIYKDVAYYKPWKIIYYAFKYDDATNELTTIFDKEKPIDVNKLNNPETEELF